VGINILDENNKYNPLKLKGSNPKIEYRNSCLFRNESVHECYNHEK